MDPEIIKYFSQLGAVGILALVFYYQNNKNSLEYSRKSEEKAKEYANSIESCTKAFADRTEAILNIERGRTEMLVSLVRDNTAQTATNTSVVVALHRRLDKEERDRTIKAMEDGR